QLKENGLKRNQCKWQVAGIRKVIESYTREAGVRELERKIGAVCRAVAAQVAQAEDSRAEKKNSKGGKKKNKSTSTRQIQTIDGDKVRDLLGPAKFQRELDTNITTPGVVVGLAY